MSLPKFGRGQDDIDVFGKQVVDDLVKMSIDILHKPIQQIKNLMNDLRAKYSTPNNPFEFIITPGIATFEDYAGIGSFLGASADGRRNCHTVSSDFSPMCWPLDLPVHNIRRPAIKSLKSWKAINVGGINISDDPIGVGISNGAPVDINIREDFPEDQLHDLIIRFAKGEIGSNMLSVTCADPDTLLNAQNSPERYDLVRMRMGGWSEFFVAMFPHHQEQHKRRPLFEAENEDSKSKE